MYNAFHSPGPFSNRSYASVSHRGPRRVGAFGLILHVEKGRHREPLVICWSQEPDCKETLLLDPILCLALAMWVHPRGLVGRPAPPGVFGSVALPEELPKHRGGCS